MAHACFIDRHPGDLSSAVLSDCNRLEQRRSSSLLAGVAIPDRCTCHAHGRLYPSQSANHRPALSNEDQPIWAKNVYPIGISLLLIMIILLGLFGWDGTLQFGNWFAGLLSSLLTVGLLWLTPRLRILNPVRAHWVRPANASWLDWGYQALWNLYRQLGRSAT